MIKIGILGGEANGSNAIDIIRRIPFFRLVGFYDPDPLRRETLERTCRLHSFSNPEMLTGVADAIDITGPLSQYPSAFRQAIRESKHVFLHNPYTGKAQVLRELLKLIGESRGVVQVSQPHRFNPAFLAACPYVRTPGYMEFQRKIPFQRAGNSQSLVLQYLMHDIDLAMYLTRSNIRKSSVSGVKLVSAKPDLVEARLEFENGCVANFMINRVGQEQSHTCHLYQTGMTIRIDLLRQTAEIQHLKRPVPANVSGTRPATEQLLVTPSDPLADEMMSFHTSIHNRQSPLVNLEDAFRALEISLDLQERLNWLSVN
ncbi:MAG TPA: Gfo/Idh/MocA family oxidoreductase [Bacteroidetes bacterium]|nr:Gfo/Idh/MocA family oxidoreductase [Bacteroidota bacterium]